MELTIRRLGVLSLGKIMGALYALFGLIIGGLFSLFAMLGMAAGMAGANGSGEDAVFSLLFGAGAVIILPIFYGVLGFLGGLLTALLFNLVARIAGGLIMEVEGMAPRAATAGTSGGSLPPTSPAQV